MKSLLLVTAVLIGARVAAQPADYHPNENRLVGAWKLVSLEEASADGHVHKADCVGMFVFTRDGKASVQVMYRNAQTGSPYAQGGYEASYGSYHVDTDSTFTLRIEGALVRTLIGKDLKRAYQLSGNRLTVRSTDPKEHWKVVWERY
jgi:Lipocalin-like domain